MATYCTWCNLPRRSEAGVHPHGLLQLPAWPWHQPPKWVPERAGAETAAWTSHTDSGPRPGRPSAAAHTCAQHCRGHKGHSREEGLRQRSFHTIPVARGGESSGPS